MDVLIRQELADDYTAVYKLVKRAFEQEPMGGGNEQDLVERLRRSSSFIPELSLVATVNNEIVGHILLTRLKIVAGDQTDISLALAPVSVMPEYQKNGIGGMLIKAAHAKAQELGFKSIILVGHETYYPRFGYVQLDNFEISLPFEVPPQNAMVLELETGALKNTKGEVIYDSAFFQ